jgi:hypothetical protein
MRNNPSTANGEVHTRSARKERHADGRSGAAGRRGGTVRFVNADIKAGRLGGPQRVNGGRGGITWHVIDCAGEPKARAGTELPEAQRLPGGILAVPGLFFRLTAPAGIVYSILGFMSEHRALQPVKTPSKRI